MWWQYAFVFIGSLAVDIAPFPLPPAVSVMILCVVVYDLNIWIVLAIGMTGSLLGRYILTRYIHNITDKIINAEKNEDVHFIGNKLKRKGWKGHALIFLYALLPLPTTPLFIGAGMAGLKPVQIMPGFALGKTICDTLILLLGNHAAKNAGDIIQGLISVQSIAGFSISLLFIMALLFIDWRTLFQHKKLTLNFHIWK
jgi:membrane protein YqaA with SNARE-associated domain